MKKIARYLTEKEINQLSAGDIIVFRDKSKKRSHGRITLGKTKDGGDGFVYIPVIGHLWVRKYEGEKR